CPRKRTPPRALLFRSARAAGPRRRTRSSPRCLPLFRTPPRPRSMRRAGYPQHTNGPAPAPAPEGWSPPAQSPPMSSCPPISCSLLPGIGEEEFFAADLVVGDVLLPLRRQEPVDERLSEFLLHVRMLRRVDQGDAVLVEQPLVAFHHYGEIATVL